MTNYIWFCRQVDEQFPTNPDGTLYMGKSSVPYTAAQLTPSVLNTTSAGGCFRQGPGLTGITGQGTLTFSGRNMRLNDTYVFHVIVSKGNRNATTETRVTIVDYVPLDVVAGYEIEDQEPLNGF